MDRLPFGFSLDAATTATALNAPDPLNLPVLPERIHACKECARPTPCRAVSLPHALVSEP